MAYGMGRGGHFYRQTDEKPHITKALLARIAFYFKPYIAQLAAMSFAVIVIALLGLVPPILTKTIIDTALPQKNLRVLVFCILLSLGTTLVLNLISVGQNYLNTVISKRIIRDLRNTMYDKLQNMPLRFFSDVKSGEITSRISNDIGGIEGVFSSTFIQILQSVFIFTTTAVTLFLTNWILAIVSLAILPLFLIPTRRVGKARWEIATKTQSKLAELTSIIAETLNVSGIMLIKIFTREKEKSCEFREINDEVTKLDIRESVVGRWFILVIQTFTSTGPILIYLFGGMILIWQHSITIGGIVLFVTLLGRLYGPVTVISNIHVDIVRSMALFERIFEFIDLESEITEKSGAGELNNVKGKIEFDRVGFRYGEGKAALSDIDFIIEPGKMAAFVGPSGAGKTTITYLLPRLYDVSSGTIRIDGTDVKEVTLASLRGAIGMVTQDTFLFNASIRENLLFAQPQASQDEIESACRAANIHEFIITLEKGYDTVVGDRGIKLSGGEKQRISIARTLLKNPSIVIFDEATSALDSQSEQLVQQVVGPLLKGRTSLVIAHRLSTIVNADIIFAVDGGRIVERGTHAELLAQNGLYRMLYETQFKAAAGDAFLQ